MPSLQEGLAEDLNDPRRDLRMGAVERMAAAMAEGALDAFPDAQGEVNNHIHTAYSFGPYFPARAALEARRAGLRAAGSVDHDSVAAAPEMTAACRALAMGSTVGCEIRVHFSGTPLEGYRMNNPDSTNSAYIVIHGVPHHRLAETTAFLAPINAERNRRNRLQVEKLNGLLGGTGLDPLDYDGEVVPLSQAAEGGSVTERHILFGLARRMAETWGRGAALGEALETKLGLEIPEKLQKLLGDRGNPHYLYDLLGALKLSLLPRFFIQPSQKECPSVFEAVTFAKAMGAIPAYSYLGDVEEGPTGDKKAEKFEDDFLDKLILLVKEFGFQAVTYMPPRNTREQLLRLMDLCRKNDLMEISGVDINSSRQSFNCPEIRLPEFRHLQDTTWALIAHEHLATADPRLALFGEENPLKTKPLADRLSLYAEAGKSMDRGRPETILDQARRGALQGLLQGGF